MEKARIPLAKAREGDFFYAIHRHMQCIDREHDWLPIVAIGSRGGRVTFTCPRRRAGLFPCVHFADDPSAAVYPFVQRKPGED